jgi:hypothetical protein
VLEDVHVAFFSLFTDAVRRRVRRRDFTSPALPSLVGIIRYHRGMTKTAYLRVYQSMDAFTVVERDAWLARAQTSDGREPGPSTFWLVADALPSEGMATSEGAFVKRLDGRVMLCPWRTRLRMLAGLVAFHGSIPSEVADAFVPAPVALRAVRELEALVRNRPTVRSHILHANWHVPLRWFAAFDDLDRILTEDRNGLRIRYEARLSDAVARLARVKGVLVGIDIDDSIREAIGQLGEWLEGFDGDGLLELDYGSVAGTFADEELVDDRSAAQVGACVDALESGDHLGASALFAELTERWALARSSEGVN